MGSYLGCVGVNEEGNDNDEMRNATGRYTGGDR